MGAYFYLRLDTVGPNIEVIAPSYTTPNNIDEIVVMADENLSPYQEIYIVDSFGIRHDYTFSLEGDRYVGLVSFNGFPYGMATIYARTQDVVGNFSSVASKSINVKESLSLLVLDIDDIEARIEIDDNV